MDPAILGPGLRDRAPRNDPSHWFVGRANGTDERRARFRFQDEPQFSQVGEFAIGHHYLVQASPYASRRLIEIAACAPITQAVPDNGQFIRATRLRDLAHRFLGDPKAHSFQRRLIADSGGFAASYPINWGWRATGGVSPAGLATGALAFIDALTDSRGVHDGFAGRILDASGIAGRHSFRRLRRWLTRDFVYDTVFSRQVLDAGVIDEHVMRRVVAEHFARRCDHHAAIVAAIDLALAYRVFVCSE